MRLGDSHGVLTTALETIASVTGRDFFRYKRATLQAVLQHEIADTPADEYVRGLRDPRAAHALADRFLVTMTEFFRDPQTWQELASLLRRRLRDRESPTLRIWCVGCASGEEAYSLAITALEVIEDIGETSHVQILASDVHAGALQRARAGVYSRSAVRGVAPNRIERFFERAGTELRIAPRVRDLVTFTNHDVMQDQPFGNLDLIMCRNVLMYFERAFQDFVLERFQYALKPNGTLVLGSDDRIAGDHFAPCASTRSMYTRTGSPVEIPAVHAPPSPNRVHVLEHELSTAHGQLRTVLEELAVCRQQLASTAMELSLVSQAHRLDAAAPIDSDEWLLREVGLAVVVVDPDRRIVLATPAARALLGIGPGQQIDDSVIAGLAEACGACRVDGIVERELVGVRRWWLYGRRTSAGSVLVFSDISALERQHHA